MSAVLIPTASEAGWLAARRQGVTASEIAVIMGLSPYSSPYALYHQKLGNLPPQEDNLVLRVGRHNESLVCELFAERHQEFHVKGDGRALYAHSERPWQMATPDRLVSDIRFDMIEGVDEVFEEYEPHAVLEAKTAVSYDGWGDDGTDEIPVHYRCQVLWQMDVMGVSSAFVACLFLHTRQLRVYEIGHAEGCGPGRNMIAYPSLACAACDDMAIMLDAAGEFRQRLRDGNPPDVDYRPATLDALKALHPDVEDTDAHIGRQMEISYRAAIKRYKEAEQRKDEMTARLRQAMGSARRAVARGTYGPDGDRVVIATRQVYPVKEHVRQATTVDKLIPATPKKEKTS